MVKDAARELMIELEQDLRRHEASARELLAKVPTDADESNVRQHVRLRSKATTYGHAAELVADAATRLPKPETTGKWKVFADMLVSLEASMSRSYGLDGASFRAGAGNIYIYVPNVSIGIQVGLDKIEALGLHEALHQAFEEWKRRNQ